MDPERNAILNKLRAIEKSAQDRWDEEKMFEVDAPEPGSKDAGKEKYMVTFPFPYMNGRAHLGHTFTLTKCDFAAGFQRMLGKRCLYPFGFHCTGMPIKAAADKLKKEMEIFGYPPKFPAENQNGDVVNGNDDNKSEPQQPTGDLKYQWQIMLAMGLTDSEIKEFADPLHWMTYFPPHWKNDLKSLGVKVDWRRSFISTDANPYFDSFIRWVFSKYKANNEKVKFARRLTIFSPKDNQPCIDHDRQKGEGVLPREFTLIKMKIKEPFPSKLAKLTGRNVFLVAATQRPELIYGKINCCLRPDIQYVALVMKSDEIFICTKRSARNMSFQEMTPEYGEMEILAELVGKDMLGIPVEAPCDSFHTLYTCAMMNINEEKGTGIVLNAPANGTIDLTAALRNAKIQPDSVILYREPETTVISRSNDECVVALCDQWYFDYGEPSWRAEADKCLDGINTFSEDVRKSLVTSLDRMYKLACSRTEGLGTKIPWDKRYVIESLSDCTVHMAYYTVCYLLQGGVWQGSDMGPAQIKPEDLTLEVWDYVFLKDKSYPESSNIPKSILDKMKTEFNYWYPVDVRMSGKDLIPNHLVYYIYGHTAIWPNESDKWPKGIRANGYLMLNAKKMSKSTGNFCTLEEAVKKFSADGTRFTLAYAGDTVDDANFSQPMAEECLVRLSLLVEWVREMMDAEGSMRTGPEWDYTHSDMVFAQEMNRCIIETKGYYVNNLFKAALSTGFFELQAARDKYRDEETQGLHRDLVLLFIETQALLMAPICPHVAEHIWGLMGKKESIMHASWPQPEFIENVQVRSR